MRINTKTMMRESWNFPNEHALLRSLSRLSILIQRMTLSTFLSQELPLSISGLAHRRLRDSALP